MQSNVLNDLAKAKRRRTVRSASVASARPRRASKRVDCRLWKHGTSFINRTERERLSWPDKQVQRTSFGFVFGASKLTWFLVELGPPLLRIRDWQLGVGLMRFYIGTVHLKKVLGWAWNWTSKEAPDPMCVFFLVGARCLSAGRTWDSRVDQQGFEPPPAVCQRWQDQRHTNWAIGSPHRIQSVEGCFWLPCKGNAFWKSQKVDLLKSKWSFPPANLLKRLFQVEVDLTSNSCEWKLELERSMFARLLFLTFWEPKQAPFLSYCFVCLEACFEACSEVLF